MKSLRNLLIVVIGAAALTAVPVKSHAGIIGDILSALFGGKNYHHTPPPPPPPPPPQESVTLGYKPPVGGGGNSVPLGAGEIFLVVAGLGLGAKMLFDRRGSGVI